MVSQFVVTVLQSTQQLYYSVFSLIVTWILCFCFMVYWSVDLFRRMV